MNNLHAFTLWSALGDRRLARARSDRAERAMNTGYGMTLAGVALR